MAVEPPTTIEGLPLSHATQKSFATALVPTAPVFSGHVSASGLTDLAPPISGLHKGCPSIAFDDSAVQDLSKPFGWSVIGKFVHGYNKSAPEKGRPSTQDIYQYLLAMDFKGGISVGLLDNRHAWIRFSTEEDYLRLYSRPVWYIGRIAMRIFKWTPFFRVDIESSLVPVWVTFPRLPVQFFHKKALHPIASLLGVPLRPDTATMSLKRPSVARIQIELDLLKPRHDKIWIEVGSAGGFWQKVEYESIPHYCTHCMHVGYQEQFCTVYHPELKASDTVEQRPRFQKDKASSQTKTDVNRQWLPKQNTESATVGHTLEDAQLGNHVNAKNGGNDVPIPLDHPPLPVIFCGDASDSEVGKEIIVDLPSVPTAISSSLPSASLAEVHASSVWSPGSIFSKPVIFCGDDTPSGSTPLSAEVFPVLSSSARSMQSSMPVPRLNVNATAWFPQNRDPSIHAQSSQQGRQLPSNFGLNFDSNIPDDDYSSWRTVESGEDDAEEEDSGRENSMEDFLDSQHVRDDEYLEQRRSRQARRDCDILLMRRGRGRTLGSRNRTYSDEDHPIRQSARINKGIPPTHFDPGL